MKTLKFQACTRALSLAAGLAALLAGAAPATAQWFYEPRSPRPYLAPIQPYEPYGTFDRHDTRRGPVESAISPRWILRSLAAQGYEPVSRLRRTGDVYRIEVEDEWGDRLRLTIDAYDGEIIRRSRQPSRPSWEREGRSFEERPRPAPRRPTIEEDGEEEIVLEDRPPPRVSRVEPPAAPPAPAARPRAAETERAARVEPPAGRAQPIAPVPPVRPAAPEAAKPPAAPAPQARAAPPVEETQQSRRSVRVIEGVTPVLPRSENLGLPAPDVPPPVSIE